MKVIGTYDVPVSPRLFNVETNRLILEADTTEGQVIVNLPKIDGSGLFGSQAEVLVFLPEATNSAIVKAYGGDGLTKKATITLTGTSGTANVIIDGTNFLSTFDTSLPETATDFVTARTAALAAKNVTVTADGAALTFDGPAEFIEEMTIANVSGNLAGTKGAVTNSDNDNINGAAQVTLSVANTSLLVSVQSEKSWFNAKGV